MFLLCITIYYFTFSSAKLLNVHLPLLMVRSLSYFEISLAYLQNYFYALFILSYLGIEKTTLRIKYLLKYYCYYNLFLAALFPVLIAMNIPVKSLYEITSVVTLPVTVFLLYLLFRLRTKFAAVVLYGTACSVTGTLISFYLLLTSDPSFALYAFVPVQMGFLCDLFILGYGLSLKAAESDRKLIFTLSQTQRMLEQERNRHARELYDGLGNKLDEVKQSLIAFEQNKSLSPELALSFKHCVHILDSSICEMQRIAYNMLPENLLRFGLVNTLGVFCKHIADSGAAHISYQATGYENYTPNTEISVALLRVGQELISNALKHAKAANIAVQLSLSKQYATLIVQDNGVGFSPMAANSGMGIQNLNNRVKLLNGYIKFESQIGEGTKATVSIPLL